jgi:hypothetical protein
MNRYEILSADTMTMGFLMRCQFYLYKVAVYATINLIDDAAMLALLFS